MQLYCISNLSLIYFLINILCCCEGLDSDLDEVHKTLKPWTALLDEENANTKQYSFRVDVWANKIFCFYQEVGPYQALTLDLEVNNLNYYDPDDDDVNKIGVYLRNVETNELVDQSNWAQIHQFDDDTIGSSGTGGVYEFCLNNTGDYINTKPVSVFLMIYRLDLGSHMHKLVVLTNVTERIVKGLKKLQADIVACNRFLQHYSAVQNRAIAYAESLNLKVLYWSILSCLVILSTGIMQVYFIKRLFDKVQVDPN